MLNCEVLSEDDFAWIYEMLDLDLAANLSAIQDVRLIYLHLILEVAYANLERSSLKRGQTLSICFKYIYNMIPY